MNQATELNRKFNLVWNAELSADLNRYRSKNISLSQHVRTVLQKYFEVENKGGRRASDKISIDLTAKQKRIRARHEGHLNDRIQLRISASLIERVKEEARKRQMNQSQVIRLILSDWVIRQLD